MTNVPGSPAARQFSTSSKPAAAQASSHCASDRVVMWTPTFSGQSRLSSFGVMVHANHGPAAGLEPGFTEGGEHGAGSCR